MAFSLDGKRIWVAGHRGMVGSAVVRALEARGGCIVLTVGRETVDLREQAAVHRWMEAQRPDAVIVAAAKVGGIHANDTYPVDFLYDNLVIAANVIHAAHQADVAKLLFLGSSCIYPKLAAQPMIEDALLTGPLEPTNEWYAVAKIAGIKLCEAYRRQHGRNFISAMPTNLYGPNDNFDLLTSHVLPALLRKIHTAKVRGEKSVTLWGTGTPKREFMHVDDLGSACLFLMQHYEEAQHINVGVGTDVSIGELARIIAGVVGFRGEFVHDLSKPDGPPRKLMDSARLTRLGWRPRIGLEDGVRETYAWFLRNEATARAA
jgi:GDP-L-fucose synthase